MNNLNHASKLCSHLNFFHDIWPGNFLASYLEHGLGSGMCSLGGHGTLAPLRGECELLKPGPKTGVPVPVSGGGIDCDCQSIKGYAK